MPARATKVDVTRAQQIWADYQANHDISDRLGQAVGIDPSSGRIWFGKDIVDIGEQMKAEGLDIPLYFVRAGRDYYYRKGGRR